jgi:hypothetical protein
VLDETAAGVEFQDPTGRTIAEPVRIIDVRALRGARFKGFPELVEFRLLLFDAPFQAFEAFVLILGAGREKNGGENEEAVHGGLGRGPISFEGCRWCRTRIAFP